MCTTKIISVFVGLAAVGAAPDRGLAQDTQAAFDRLDVDRSGTVSWAEAYEVRTGEFMDMDSDMDGVVTEDEFRGPARPFAT